MTILIPMKFLKNMNGRGRQEYVQRPYWREDLEVSLVLLLKGCCKSAVKELVVILNYIIFKAIIYYFSLLLSSIRFPDRY